MAIVAPIIHVFDVDATVAYYCDVLGFELDWAIDHYDSGRNTFASVNWFGAALKFVDPGEPTSDVTHSRLGAGMAFSFEDDAVDIDGYFAGLKERGVEIVLEIADQPSGHRSFHIRDLNGYHSRSRETARRRPQRAAHGPLYQVSRGSSQPANCRSILFCSLLPLLLPIRTPREPGSWGANLSSPPSR